LAPFRDELAAAGAPFVVSALGRGGSNHDEFLAALCDDLGAVAAFRQHHGAAVEVDVLEARLPADVLGADRYDEALRLLGAAARVIDEAGPPALKPFYEMPLREGWQIEVEELMEVLDEDAAAADETPRPRCGQAGFKLRCGGAEASAFPSAEQVAWTLVNALDREVPLKFTAGGDHPPPPPPPPGPGHHPRPPHAPPGAALPP